MAYIAIVTRDVPNIPFVFASVPNSAPNSVFVFGRIVKPLFGTPLIVTR